ncbi:MAG: hypothetical protein WA705_06065 [Candidatus Ozemobacteraceae bacterium]
MQFPGFCFFNASLAFDNMTSFNRDKRFFKAFILKKMRIFHSVACIIANVLSCSIPNVKVHKNRKTQPVINLPHEVEGKETDFQDRYLQLLPLDFSLNLNQLPSLPFVIGRKPNEHQKILCPQAGLIEAKKSKIQDMKKSIWQTIAT